MQPTYREQRSLSFSVGQDPTFFGYDDYHDDSPHTDSVALGPSFGYKNSLATMEEEGQEDDLLHDMINQELSAARWRARSQSSGAAFGLLPPSQQHLDVPLHRQLRRGSEQLHDDSINQRRRSSRFFNGVGMDEPSHLVPPGVSSGYPPLMMDKQRLDVMQRRLPQSQPREYKFPDQRYTTQRGRVE
jgi:hypothetical protein